MSFKEKGQFLIIKSGYDEIKNSYRIFFSLIFIAIIFATAYSLIRDKTITGSIQITPLNLSQMEDYRMMNARNFLNIYSYDDKLTKYDTPEFDLTEDQTILGKNIFLHDLFYEKIVDRDFLRKIIIENDLLSIKSFNKNSASEIDEFIQAYEVLPPIWTQSDATFYRRYEQDHILIKFSYSDNNTSELKEAIRKLIMLIVVSGEEEVLNSIKEIFGSSINYINSEINLLEENTKKEMQSMRLQYDLELAQEIKYLNEQILIARSIDLAKPMIKNELNITGEFVNKSTHKEGYLILEENVKLLKSRESADLYIPEIIPLKQRLNNIENMNFSKLLEDSMKVSPISNDFKIGNYNFRDIKIIENYYSNYFIYAIFLFFTIVFYLSVVLFKLYLNFNRNVND